MYVGYMERPLLKIKQSFYFSGLKVPREKPSLKTGVAELFGINTRLYGRQSRRQANTHFSKGH